MKLLVFLLQQERKKKKTHADWNNCRIFCESNLCIFSCLEQMYTKQWWPPLSFSMGLGWCAPLLSGNCSSSISNINENARNSIVCRHWETCNLRVTWPAGSHRRCPVEHVSCHTRNESRYAPVRVSECVCWWRRRSEGQMCCFYNELTSFVLLIIICHLWEHNKGYNHGYSARAQRKRRRESKNAHCAKPFHLLQKQLRINRNIYSPTIQLYGHALYSTLTRVH